jgi:hypothetical protein
VRRQQAKRIGSRILAILPFSHSLDKGKSLTIAASVSKSRQIAKAKIMALVLTTAANYKGEYWRDQPKCLGGDADGQ